MRQLTAVTHASEHATMCGDGSVAGCGVVLMMMKGADAYGGHSDGVENKIHHRRVHAGGGAKIG